MEPGDIGTPEVTDNCGEVVLTFEDLQFSGSCVVTYERMWTATDECGNTATCTQIINVVDTTAPIISAAADTSVECGNDLPEADAIAEDACTEVTWTYSETFASDCGETGVYTRVYTATDACGNTATDTQTITVVDTTPPSITAADDAIIECGSDMPGASAAADDSCGNATWTVTESFDADCGDTGVWTRVYTATDDCGNTATDTQTITIVDTTAPVITCADDTEIDCIDADIAPAITGFTTATDNCGDATVAYSDVFSTNECPVILTRTWTATDECGNTSMCEQTITIYDETAPEINAPDDITIDCEDSTAPGNTGAATATDACSGLNVTFVDGPMTGSCPYTFVRTWTAVDGCENSMSADQVITIVDETAPTLVEGPADTEVECTEELPAPVEPEFADNCDDILDISMSTSENALDCGYEVIRTWTATDECGNTGTYSQTITIVDNNAPTFSNVPADMDAECDNIPDVVFPAAMDACDDDVNIVLTEVENHVNDCELIITRTWVATDNCGNSNSVSQVITVTDSTSPELEAAPADVEVDCGAIPAAVDLSATDNCDDAPTVAMTEEYSTGGCPYTITRTWTASDNCGNTSVEVQVITVIDTEAPTVGDYEVVVEVACDELGELTIPGMDNCDADLTYDYVDFPFSGGCLGSIQRVWTVSDDCGNTYMTNQFIILIDEVAPEVFNAPSDVLIECGEDVPAVPDDVFATDNCDDNVELEFTEEQTGTDCPFVITRTWTFTDECSNSTVVTQIISAITEIITDDLELMLAPNPMTDNGVITFVVPEDGFVRLEVLNYLGQTVKVVYEGSALGDLEYRINEDMSKLDAGFYITRLIFNGEKMTQEQLIKVN